MEKVKRKQKMTRMHCTRFTLSFLVSVKYYKHNQEPMISHVRLFVCRAEKVKKKNKNYSS